MTIKINFGAESSETPNGYILDFGEEYSQEKGYGWVTQESLATTNPTPISITGNGRDRDIVENELFDSFIHLQYPEQYQNSLSDTTDKTPVAWEYDLADGTYRVIVGAGDPSYFDSRHKINIEGVEVVSNFVSSDRQLFAYETAIVEVSDGKLTIDGEGGENTKLGFLRIDPVEIVRVNFGTATAEPPTGFIQDFGEEYSREKGYGWVSQASAGSSSLEPLDISPNGRDRNAVSPETLDSLMHLQYPEDYINQDAVNTPAAWEYKIGNGQYAVRVSVGDNNFLDSNHAINIEGKKVISGFAPTKNSKFQSASTVVNVRDGSLTVDAIGGENTKLNFIEIVPVEDPEVPFADLEPTPIVARPIDTPVDRATPSGDINVNFGTAVAVPPTGFIQDTGAAYSEDRGFGWIAQDGGEPLDITANGRTRGLIAETAADSLIHLQYPTGIENDIAVRNPAIWEYELENGSYEVTVSVGDAQYIDSSHLINVEGQNLISGFVPTKADRFEVATATIEVNDGRLTVDAIGGENTKINYITIAEA